jgi:hypothetical protein
MAVIAASSRRRKNVAIPIRTLQQPLDRVQLHDIASRDDLSGVARRGRMCFDVSTRLREQITSKS